MLEAIVFRCKRVEVAHHVRFRVVGMKDRMSHEFRPVWRKKGEEKEKEKSALSETKKQRYVHSYLRLNWSEKVDEEIFEEIFSAFGTTGNKSKMRKPINNYFSNKDRVLGQRTETVMKKWKIKWEKVWGTLDALCLGKRSKQLIDMRKCGGFVKGNGDFIGWITTKVHPADIINTLLFDWGPLLLLFLFKQTFASPHWKWPFQRHQHFRSQWWECQKTLFH